MAPMLIVLALVAGWPLLRTIWFSLTDANLSDLASAEFVGFLNYYYLLQDPDWWSAVWNTIVFTLISVTVETILGLGIALALDAHLRAPGAARRGPDSLGDPDRGLGADVVLDVPRRVRRDQPRALGDRSDRPADCLDRLARHRAARGDPGRRLEDHAVHGILLLAGLQMLPQECYESAKVDGVHPVKVFFKVTLPLLKPALMVAIIFRALDAMRIFDLIYVMNGNNKDTMSMSVYARQQLVDFQDVGYGSAAATLLFLIIALFTVVYLVLGRVGRDREERAAAPRGPWSSDRESHRRRVLGRLGFYCLLAVIIFYTVFPFYWAIVSSLKSGSELFKVEFWPSQPAWDNYVAVFREQPFGRNILNSIFVAVSTVILSLGLAVLAAYALGRIQFRGRMPLLFTVLACRCSRRSRCCRACSS